MIRNFTVALTDDDSDEHLLFADALSTIDENIHLISFTGGEDLLNDLFSYKCIPHLVFIDINMPQLDGFETIMRIRAQQKFKDLPVVMYSTSTNRYDVTKSYGLGATLYLRKETTQEALVTNLKKIVSIVMQHNSYSLPQIEYSAAYIRR